MTPAQKAYLTYLATGDAKVLLTQRVTISTAQACIERGWAKKSSNAVPGETFNGREITSKGRKALKGAQKR